MNGGTQAAMFPRSGRDEPHALDYHVGLSRLREAVISSHFMDAIARDRTLDLYATDELVGRSLTITERSIDDCLLPALIGAARAFGENRGLLAIDRARQHPELYDLAGASDIGIAEVVAEVMFDRQFARKAISTCSRSLVRDRVRTQLERNEALRMVIPALPFKIRSPLKSRGDLPDLAEVGFVLSLFEIALAIEIAAARMGAARSMPAVQFVVVSDGDRFASLVNMPSRTITQYHRALQGWIDRLGLGRYVVIEDYRELLIRCLPGRLLAEKRRISDVSRALYAQILGPVFDPDAMDRALASSRVLEPDPEESNDDGRFGTLLRSLVYTIDYRALAATNISGSARHRLYRELAASLFAPTEPAECPVGAIDREALRRAMLTEVWQATIDYMAEIKSDRDLEEDPMLACLPGAIRWTIHVKAGQFAIAAPTVGGTLVQPWAGTAVFRPADKGSVRLCSYPVLGLEGTGAIPVLAASSRNDAEPQPLFYIDRRLAPASIEDFLSGLGSRLTRRRMR